MILQALTRYYDTLCAQNKLSPPGWDAACKVSFALDLDEDGTLFDVTDKRRSELRGKKSMLVPAILSVPARVGRTVGISANFLCDNSSYLLGVDAKGQPGTGEKVLCRRCAATPHTAGRGGLPHRPGNSGLFRQLEPGRGRRKPVFAGALGRHQRRCQPDFYL